MPSSLLFLRGIYINQIVPDKGTRMHGFCISHESKMVRTRVFYNKNREVVEDWVRLLRTETGNLSFDEKFIRGPKLGNGKFSTVL